MYFIFPPHLTCASALSGETENHKLASFHLNAACFLPKTTSWNTLKYHLVTAEPPFTVKMIDWMHQTGRSILLSVTHMLYVIRICHGVGRCVKDGCHSSSSLSESQWTVLMGYLSISTYLDATKHSTDDNFSFRKTAMCLQHSPTAAALLTNTSFQWKMWFSCFPVLPRISEAQVIWCGILKHLLIAYFIGNISAKKVKRNYDKLNMVQSMGREYW